MRAAPVNSTSNPTPTQHTSAYVSIRQSARRMPPAIWHQPQCATGVDTETSVQTVELTSHDACLPALYCFTHLSC